MFYKLMAMILVLGVTAAMLLVVRQQRIDIAHDMAQTHQRLVDHETQLWRLRAEVVRRCRPEDVRDMIEASQRTWQQIPQRPTGAQPDAQPDPAHLAERAPRAHTNDRLIEG